MNDVLTNYHTHTSYCDGSDTPRDLALCALRKGFCALGFSGHSSDAAGYGMEPEVVDMYRLEVETLKREFEGRMDIFLGLEIDSTCDVIPDWPEYIIGSTHMLKSGEQYYFVDNTAELFGEGVEQGFGGDVYALAEAYYAELARHAREIRPDIIGHFDLLTKYNADGRFFDPSHKRYIDCAFAALEEVVGLGCIIEVNTGGMARGATKSPYPDKRILARIRELNGAIMINSDAHSVDKLAYGFNQAVELCAEAGFSERMELTKERFAAVAL